MAEFVWEARARTGELRKGTMEAETVEAVNTKLKSQQLSPVKVKKKPKELSLAFGSPVSSKDLVIFTRQFSTMIDAGLPLVQCLDILGGQSDNKAFAAILKDIRASLEGGGTFSEALARHPKVFDELYVNLVAAGEMGGILDTILNRIASYIEKRVKLARQVRSALVYPMSIFVIALAVLAVMLTWVIPAFKKMFADFGGEDSLPALTQGVIATSDWFVGHILYIIGIAVAVGVSFRMFLNTPTGKSTLDKFLLAAPILGPVMRKIAVSRFTRTLGTLLSSGVPILEALNIVAKASGNVVIERAINDTTDKIREGRTMSEPLLETKVFPGMVVQMIGVGEQTGALDNMLNKIADFYEEEVDVAVAALTSMLEPLMMVFIGGMVGTLLIAMYLPIFTLASKITGQ